VDGAQGVDSSPLETPVVLVSIYGRMLDLVEMCGLAYARNEKR
jgi:hypothetical protein